MKKQRIIVLILIILLLVLAGFVIARQTTKNLPLENPRTGGQNTQNERMLSEPISDFKARITKKPFGIFVTPQNSPVRPERFTGYHTAVDVEYQDVTQDVSVVAASDGEIVLSRTASGYGGVLAIKSTIDGRVHTIIYGHLRPSSLPKVGLSVKKGEKIALLGTGYSSETDGERRHLHFGILSDDRIDLKGYVGNQSELSGWVDPLSFY